MKSPTTQTSSSSAAPSDQQALALHESVDKIMRRFKLEPGMLAGSAYANLHVNDVGLLAMIAEPGNWNLKKLTDALAVPLTTISSALDRLEVRQLVKRQRSLGDRRIVSIELTQSGNRLVARLRTVQIETCRQMLRKLPVKDREELIRLVAQVAQR